MKLVYTFLLSITVTVMVQAQNTNNMWNNKKCAVVFTYDDGLNVHLDNAIPALNKNDLKGTFYIPGKSNISERMNDWRIAAEQGHELGNHTLFHPCNGKSKGRDWVSENYDLDNYTQEQIRNEIAMANTLLKAVDGKTIRTFAYTCGDSEAEGKTFTDFIEENFAGARGVSSELNFFNAANLMNINAVVINGNSAEEMKKYVDQAIKENALLVFLFHGVGGEHSMNVSLDDHNELLDYVHSMEASIWNAPLVDIVEYIKNNRP